MQFRFFYNFNLKLFGEFKYSISNLLSMFLKETENSENFTDDAGTSFENWCIVFNEFIEIFFLYLKFILVFVLFYLGIFTLLKLRAIYFNMKAKGVEPEEDPIKKERLTVGFMYIFLGFGILFNYLIYFLIWALDPLPDRFIFRFINFNSDIDPYGWNRIEDLRSSEIPHEKTMYYCFALLSFYALSNLLISFWMLWHPNKKNKTPRLSYGWFLKSLALCILFGFTTCLPLLL